MTDLTRAARSNRRRERGQVLAEFALVAVVFFLFLFGVFDMARMFQSWITVQHAARESARYAITGLTTCDGASGRDACIEWTAKDATLGIARGGPNALDADVDVDVRAWDFLGDSWSANATGGETGKSCDQIEVTVNYEHRFVTPFLQVLLPGGIDLQGNQRMTNEPYGPCATGDGVT